ncbi:hypothetical protein CsSME_00006303 [Camellia sinensis var. sinensis]
MLRYVTNVIQQAQKFFMETNDTTDPRNATTGIRVNDNHGDQTPPPPPPPPPAPQALKEWAIWAFNLLAKLYTLQYGLLLFHCSWSC